MKAAEGRECSLKPPLSDFETVVQAARSASTVSTYARAWRQFSIFCEEQGFCALPADQETVQEFCLHLKARRLRPASAELYLRAVAERHHREGLAFEPGALAKSFLAGYRRMGPERRTRRPLLVEDLAKILAAMPTGTLAQRVRKALVLTGFVGGFRRSELSELRTEHVEFLPRGARLLLPQSKTDQERDGRLIQIPWSLKSPYCAAKSLQDLIAEKPSCRWVFCRAACARSLPCEHLSARTVARTVKHYAQVIGLNPADFSAHSLRSGFATAAAEAGATDREIADQTGHRDLAQLSVYVWPARNWATNASAKVLENLIFSRDCKEP